MSVYDCAAVWACPVVMIRLPTSKEKIRVVITSVVSFLGSPSVILRNYCIEKEEELSKINPRAVAALRPRSAVLQFSTAFALTAFFLAALSPREFHCATEAPLCFLCLVVSGLSQASSSRS